MKTIKREKTKIEVDHILEDDIKKAIDQMIRFSFHSKTATRSSNRTDEIHNRLKQITEKLFYISDLRKNKIEVIIDSQKNKTTIPSTGNKNKKFSVDMLITQSDKNKIAVAVKAPVASLGKNYSNMINNEDGELLRVFKHKKNLQDDLTFFQINFIPRIAPIFDSNKNILSFENINLERPEDDENYTDEAFGHYHKLKNVINVYYSVNKDVYNSNTVKNVKDLKNVIAMKNDNDLIENLEINNLNELYLNISELIVK